MATLYFKVSSDWEQVVKLRQECEKLETQLKKMDSRTAPAATKTLETQLESTKQQMMGLVTEAAKAGATMENDLKRKIDSVTKSSDELSSEIIKQRTIIRETQEDVRRLSEQYSKMGKYSPQSTSTLNQLNKAKAALNEQRYALGELQDQQAKNRLELRQLTREYHNFSQGTDKATVTVDALMSSLKRTAAEIGGLAAIRKFGSDVMNATGTMQQLHVALSTILQDGDKASKLIGEITRFAAKTPFNLEDVASGAKQLLAYGSSAETVVDELSMLGDVAAGLQIPIGQLIYLYGTLRTQGRAMTVDIRQFAGRGIPIYEELAKVLGVTKDQVGELVTAGKVGFKEVEQAFKNMTSEGGKFNDLMENSAGTWPQRLSNIQDTLFQKLNDFGNKYKEVFEFGIGTTEELVEHLDDVISVIGGLIAAYGTYKAALIAAAVAQKAVGFVDSIRLIMAYRKQLGLATAAQQAFNLAAKSNVYVALLSVLVGLGTAIYMFTKRTNEATAAQKALSKVNKKADDEFSTQAATIDRLNGILKSETASLDQKKKALSELQAIVPNYNASLNKEGELINNNTEAIKAYLTQLEKQIKLKAAQEELEELYRKKRQQEKQKQTATENYNKVQSLYNSSSTLTANALQRRGINTGVAVFAQNNAVNNQLKDNANKAKKELDDINSKLGETLSGIAAIEKEIEQTSLSDKKDMSQSSISKELENVTKRIKTLKQEIAGLRSGKLQAEAGKTVESAIKAKEKELKTANETLETLTGNKPKTEKQTKSESDKQKKSLQKLADELLELRRRNQKAETALMKEGTKKKLEQINDDYEAQKAEIEKKARELAELNRKSGISGTNANGLTAEQQAEIDRANKLNDESRNKQSDEVYKAEREAMRNYLQEYGTFQQQKLAIAQEYADKIAKAQSEGERMALEKRRDAAIAQVNTNALKMDIDWATAFSGLDGVFSEVIKPVLDKVKEYARTEEFRGLDASDQQSVIEAISRMEESVGGLGKVKFSDLGKQVDTLQQNVLDLNSAKEEEAEAVEKLKKAQEDYEKALKDGTQEQIDISKLALDDAQNKADAASKNVENQQNIVRNSSNQLNSTVTTLDAKLKNVTQGFQQLSSGGLSNLYQGITKLVKGFGGTAEKLGDVEFIGAIFSALDALKEGISPIVEDVIGNVFGVLNNTVSDIFSGDIFVSLFDSLRDGIGGFWDAITFGGFSSWTDGNAKEVNDTINRLTERNEALQGSIDALNDTIKQGRGTISVEASRQAYEYQKEQNRNYLDMARAQAGYHNSHHSWQYYMGWSQDWIDWIRENIDETFSGTDSLWSWTPEQMQMLKSNVEIWTAMQNAGKGGYGGRVTEKLDAYIEQAGKLEDITNDLYEGLTQISFDSMYSSFIDSLMDMKYDAEAAADDISEYFMRAMLSNKIGEMYYDKLEGWWKKFGESMEDNELSESERNALANEYMKYVNEALNLRDQLAAATGYDKIGESAKKQQSATSKGFEAMTQDQASELSGRFTAVAESNYRIENATNQQTLAITQLSGSISVLASQIYGSYSIADDTRSILAQSYLELQQISENTGAIIVPIQKMQKDIERVKQNTERL